MSHICMLPARQELACHDTSWKSSFPASHYGLPCLQTLSFTAGFARNTHTMPFATWSSANLCPVTDAAARTSGREMNASQYTTLSRVITGRHYCFLPGEFELDGKKASPSVLS